MATRRQWFLGLAASAAALRAARDALAAATATQTRQVSGFDRIDWRGAGELTIEQTGREQFTVEAEPHVLARLTTEVRRNELVVGFAPGSFSTNEPIRIRIEVAALVAFTAQGSGSVRIGALKTPALALRMMGSHRLGLAALEAQTLELALEGSGAVAIERGSVERQQVLISGSASLAAERLASRTARIVIEGSGSARVAVAEALDADLSGSGSVLVAGEPRITQAISGSGRVRRLLPADGSQKP